MFTCLFVLLLFFFFFKQKTAYEMRISDWSSDVCSSDLNSNSALQLSPAALQPDGSIPDRVIMRSGHNHHWSGKDRSEEHTSELQSLMRISYAVFCLKKKKKRKATSCGNSGREAGSNKSSNRARS